MSTWTCYVERVDAPASVVGRIEATTAGAAMAAAREIAPPLGYDECLSVVPLGSPTPQLTRLSVSEWWHGRRFKENINKGSNNKQAKLNERRVLQIRKAAEAGVSFSELAVKHGVTRSSIDGVVRGRSWAHVEG